jgi:hypothetical protein
MLLDTTNGHNSAIVDKFNKLAEKFDSYGLLEIILKDFCDDGDLQDIINILEERMEQHKYSLATETPPIANVLGGLSALNLT